jgi:type IV pilus assembly protein PilC
VPIFSYVAVDSKGDSVKGRVDETDRSAVIANLSKQKLRPISIKETKDRKTQISFGQSIGAGKIKTDDLVMFTRQLSAMVGAGVPMLRALSSLADHVAENPNLKKILLGVIKDVEGGMSLGDAMGKYPATFNEVYVNMIRAGEAAGILDDILNRLALQQEKNSTIRKKIKSAMSYPIVLITITILAFFGLMIFIIPQIGTILTDLGGEDAQLPLITTVMLEISDFFIQYWYLVIAIFGGMGFAFFAYVRTEKGRYNFHSVLLKTPIIKKIIMKIAVARFTRTFSALIEAGVAVLQAIEVTSHAVGNAVFAQALREAEEEVKIGKAFSEVIAANPIFPPIVSQMLLVGEETGQTDTVIVKVADFYEEEVDRSIESLSSIIEPIMIVIMGSMVGLIAVSVMLPIASLAQSIQ